MRTMTRASAPPLLLQLQNAETLSAQAAALRSLKNETIGHDQRKESWVRWGILPVLANILAARQSPGKGTASAELAGGSKLRYPTSEEDEACLQAVIILGSLAQGI